MGKFSRDKGARGELEVAQTFREYGFDAKRMVGQSRDGSDAPDVALPAIPALWVEVKRGKATNIRAALEQARFAAPKSSWPIAVCRNDHERQAVVGMSFDFFALLLRRAFPEAVVQPDLPGVSDDSQDQGREAGPAGEAHDEGAAGEPPPGGQEPARDDDLEREG